MQIADKINNILKSYSSGNKINSYKKLKNIFLKNQTNHKLRFNLAVMEQELGYINSAKINYKFLIHNTSHLRSMINLQNIYLKEKKFEKCINLINQILKIDKKNTEILINKAYIYYQSNDNKIAIDICLEIIEKNNKNLEALNLLGLCYFSNNNFLKAEKVLLSALEIDNKNLAILNSLGRIYNENKDIKNSEKYFLKALDINPDLYQTLNNIGGFYLERGEYEKALQYYLKALKLEPNNLSILNNLSRVYFNLEKIDLAEKYILKALKKDNKHDESRKTYSLILLRKSDFYKAWDFFDGRLGLSDFLINNLSLNNIRGKLILNNKLKNNSKILIVREQGVGDEILYGSMYKDLLNTYKDVIIECDKRLIPLFKCSFENKFRNKFVEFGSISNHPEKLKYFDQVLYAGSLGKFFRKNINTFPNKPYIKSSNNDPITKLKKINKNINIGISWKSFKNRYAKEKSLELYDLKHVFSLSKCNFINLQYGEVDNEINDFVSSSGKEIIVLKNLDLFNDFIGVSELLNQLDLFISVSNSTAHLAGAMGVKTLLIKPENHAAYHYWNYPESKTPWYNNLKIISKKILKEKNKIQNLILN